jgi:hypothetical protein
MTPNQIVATIQALPSLDMDAAGAWLQGFDNPNADLTAIEDLAALVAIWIPVVGPFATAISILAPAIAWAIAHPGTGQNLGPGEGGKIGAGR